MQKYERSRGHNITIQNSADGSGEGDITFIGSGVSTTPGYVYVLLNDGEGEPTWQLADNDSNGYYEGLLAVALGTNSSNGMLLRGAVTINGSVESIGLPMYLGSTGGRMSSTLPTTSGQVVRVLGYSLSVTVDTIYFNPDNTYILLA